LQLHLQLYPFGKEIGQLPQRAGHGAGHVLAENFARTSSQLFKSRYKESRLKRRLAVYASQWLAIAATA
jgi:hypothetical protein